MQHTVKKPYCIDGGIILRPCRFGVLSPADIAIRRFLPALAQCEEAELYGIASASAEERCGNDKEKKARSGKGKAQSIANQYKAKLFADFRELLSCDEIDAVYIPLPPALHGYWAREALTCGKHVLMEKPFTTSVEDSIALIELAEQRSLALQENYAFIYHAQIKEVMAIVSSGELGDIRLVRTAFGFPYRGQNDFRYHSSKGGGALLDCGGYPIRLASLLLGPSVSVASSFLSSSRGHDVDVYGSATLRGGGVVAQVAFGMDSSYKCDLEIWGSKAYLSAKRIFTPSADCKTTISICGSSAEEERTITVAADDQFLETIYHFVEAVRNEEIRKLTYFEIEKQASLIEQTIKASACFDK